MHERKEIEKLLLKNQRSRLIAENIVVEYNNHFYKSPNFSGEFLFYKWVCPFTCLHKSYKILKEYFWDDFEIVDTHIYKDDYLSYIIKQEKIKWRALNKNDFSDEEIKRKFLKLIKINKKMWKKEGLFLDILWTDFLIKPFSIHNIFICENKKLYIFDFGLLNKKANSYIFRFVSYFFYNLQLFWIKVLFFLSDKS